MILRSELLSAVPGLAHAWSTRLAPPVLRGPSGFDLAPGAPPAAWAWLVEQAGLPGAPVALLSQVHGAAVHEVGEGGHAGAGDALITRRPGLVLAVRVADCVPVLLVDLDEEQRVLAVAAVHAGWRGLAAEVIPATLRALGPAPSRRLAAVGPCIGAAAYEVGSEVVEGIGAVVPQPVFARRGDGPGRWQADLRRAARWQLLQGGCTRVELGPWCTHEDPRLHSFRRDGPLSGRLAGIIGWAA